MQIGLFDNTFILLMLICLSINILLFDVGNRTKGRQSEFFSYFLPLYFFYFFPGCIQTDIRQRGEAREKETDREKE